MVIQFISDRTPGMWTLGVGGCVVRVRVRFRFVMNYIRTSGATGFRI